MGTVINRIDLATVMQQQAPTGQGFFCQTCQNYKGGCGCKLGYFIMCVGANTSNCLSYQEERRKK